MATFDKELLDLLKKHCKNNIDELYVNFIKDVIVGNYSINLEIKNIKNDTSYFFDIYTIL